MSDLAAVNDTLAHMDAEYARLEAATRRRIADLAVRGDRDRVERVEWGRFYEQVLPIIVEREALRGRGVE